MKLVCMPRKPDRSTVGGGTTCSAIPFLHRHLEPQTIDAAEALRLAGRWAILSIGMNIDPKDWARSLVPDIMIEDRKGRQKGKGRRHNVVLLHDRGQRAATVAALPTISRHAESRGVPVRHHTQLLGL